MLLRENRLKKKTKLFFGAIYAMWGTRSGNSTLRTFASTWIHLKMQGKIDDIDSESHLSYKRMSFKENALLASSR